MATTQLSLDAAVRGYLRHRFVRGLASSCAIFLIGLMAAMAILSVATSVVGLVGSIGEVHSPSSDATIMARSRRLLVTFLNGASQVIFALVFVLIVSVLTALIHRRMLAVAALLFFGALACLLIFELSLVFTTDDDVSYAFQPDRLDWWGGWVFLIVLLLICLEVVAWAIWQLLVPKELFTAVCGWRPSVLRPLSMLRTRLGLPAFITNFGRGKRELTAAYAGLALLNLGVLAPLGVPFILEILGSPVFGWEASTAFIVMGGFLVLGFFGVRGPLTNWAKRRAARLYQGVREWDARPPVTFLRQFEHDEVRLEAHIIDPLVKFGSEIGEARTLDELLLEHGSPYGPVIAIGDPNDPVPPFGAARVFVPNSGDTWRDQVASLISSSTIIVIVPSLSEGVQWELDLVNQRRKEIRVIILASPVLSPKDNIELFKQAWPPGESAKLPKRQMPIAAFFESKHGWRLLTSSWAPCLETYTVALNVALRAVVGAPTPGSEATH